MNKYGVLDVMLHISKVFKHFGLERHQVLTADQIVTMLKEYDKIEPVDQELADMVCTTLIDVFERHHRAQSN